MLILTNNELRKIWFSFWKSKNHDILESASLIPSNDPTLLWINAGVTPLKKYFDGTVVPSNRRMANIQKCIRTNDIENVGMTKRHLTFFEMMGNFSIGDYFKKEAIKWSWEFLTEYIQMDPKKLYVTIYPTDEEAYLIWKSLGVADNHIIKLEDNFWEIGEGPSGPDSEIFYDRGEKYDSEGLGIKLLVEDIENDRYIEVWNNVFSMYNANPNLKREEYEELPSKNIDTGMGFERMLMVTQEKDSIFETDVFEPLIKKISELCNEIYNGQSSFKLIADHARALTFALADGATFGNSGRDYVLRRLLRRAVRIGKKLGLVEGFMYKLIPVVINIMKDAYPYLMAREEAVVQKVKKEEELFHLTLIQGEKKFNEIIEESIDKKISGENAFKLYDTYGFPFELTLEMATDLGYAVSKEEFDEYMNKQKEMARSARNNVNSMNLQNENLLNFKEESKFIGYDNLEVDSKVIALFDGENFVENLNEGYIVLEKTPFYAESGGQVSDSGVIVINNSLVEIIDLFKGPNKQHFHYVKSPIKIKVGDTIKAVVDKEKRTKIMKNHSSAHLLQKALREILDDSVMQAGSRVDENTLRFDFIYEKRITHVDIIKVEEKVNQKIETKIPTKIEVLDLQEAINAGAIALFEDKYESKVRALTIADSMELCGGTHVNNVAEIERFAIINFETKGNNVYRIEATTSDNINEQLFAAIKPYNDNMLKLLSKAKKIIVNANQEGINLEFNININNEAPASYKDVIYNMDEMEKVKIAVQELERSYFDKKTMKALNNINLFEKQLEIINNVNVIVMKVENYSLEILKNIVAVLANKYENNFIFIANIIENNVNYIGRTTVKDINIGNIIKDVSVKSNGNGGGSATFAQGGGSNVSELDNIISDVKNIVISIK